VSQRNSNYFFISYFLTSSYSIVCYQKHDLGTFQSKNCWCYVERMYTHFSFECRVRGFKASKDMRNVDLKDKNLIEITRIPTFKWQQHILYVLALNEEDLMMTYPSSSSSLQSSQAWNSFVAAISRKYSCCKLTLINYATNSPTFFPLFTLLVEILLDCFALQFPISLL
jgi:hypothetical protein